MESYLAIEFLNKLTLSIGFPLFFLLASALLPIIVCFTIVFGIVKQSKLYIQCAYQLMYLGVILTSIFVLILLLVTGIYYSDIQHFLPIYQYIFWVTCSIFYLGFIFQLICIVLWYRLIGSPILYTLLSFLSGICYSSFIIISIFLFGYIFSGDFVALERETDFSIIVGLIFPSLTSPLWLIVFITHFIEAAAAGGIALVWLWIRRNKDNFGRDYYVVAANWCGVWAAYGAWIFLISFIVFMLYNVVISLIVIGWPIATVSIGLGLISALIWTKIALSNNPMRHKLSMIFAIVFFVYSMTFGSSVVFIQ